MLGVWVPVFLRQDRLDTCKTSLGWETIPVTAEQREMMWMRHGFALKLVQDHNWEDAPAHLQDTCGLPITRWTYPDGRVGSAVAWFDAAVEGKKKWLALEEEQCFWVKVEDFLKETVPARAPHLENLRIRFDGRYAKGAPEVPLYQNGVEIPFPEGVMLAIRYRDRPTTPIG